MGLQSVASLSLRGLFRAEGSFTEFTLPKGKATCGLVWMHGLGDTEEGWAEMLEDDFKTKGSCKFILPRAPRQRSTCNGGEVLTSWFDIRRLPISRKTAPHHGCSLDEGFASCGRVHAAIDKLLSEGIPSERIMVGGFSQGGAMAPRMFLECFPPTGTVWPPRQGLRAGCNRGCIALALGYSAVALG